MGDAAADGAFAGAEDLVSRLEAEGKTVAAAESCTAGLAAALIARVPGASRVLWGSFVTYSVDAKVRMLGVPEETVARYGAVSRETARAMALQALERSGADYAFSITGLAGPGGDGSGVPVGSVWIALARRGGPVEPRLFRFPGDREAVRRAAAEKALEELCDYIRTGW